MPLLLKLETKSSPVRGVSFHHKSPWILASLEDGFIQLWDYKIFKIIREYKGHDGPVRGICFHKNDPIFVSGGDDKILKVWNVDDKACVSVLSGHCDIITSCSFHRKFPWIASSSNDKTIRIWNWNIKQCVANLIGHEMAVTGAIFHPTSTIVFSSSKDGTIRVWDMMEFGNKEDSVGKITGAEQTRLIYTYNNISLDPITKNIRFDPISFDSIKTGLNSISFREEKSRVVAGSDDNELVILCYYEEKKELFIWDRYEGHDDIVNSAAYFPSLDFVIGCSDDKSIRIWEVLNHKCIDILRYQNEKFGVLSAHPSSCLFAAGHENGMILFKNRRERPVFYVNDGFVYYMKNDYTGLRRLELKTRQENFIPELTQLCDDDYSNPRRAISFNPVEDSLIVTRSTHDRKKCAFEFHKLHWDSNGKFFSHCSEGSGTQAFWISWKQFVVLNEHRKVEIRDLSNAIICELDIIADDIFYAGTGIILLKIREEYKLFDVEKKKVTASVELKDEIRYVIWSESEEYAAFLAKKKLMLLNRKLEIICIHEESNNLKSGCWIDESVFVYNTRYQLKYALTLGDSGTIKTLEKQLYIFATRGSILCCFDKHANIVEVPIESFEYKPKLALFHGRTDEVLQLLKSEHAKCVGQSVITALVKYGYSDVALNFEKDDRARFLLALEFENLEKALEFAEHLDEYAWTTLAEAALLHGNHKIAEICYLKTNNYGKLSFLYFVTGNTAKLIEMMRIIDDPNTQFQIALLIGDIGERIRILKRYGQIPLAYLAATTHGHDNEVDGLKQELEFKKRSLPQIDANPRFLVPPRPVHRIMENWPVVKIADSLNDPVLGGSNTCEKLCEEEKEKLEEQIEEKLEENDDYEEIVDEESETLSGPKYLDRKVLEFEPTAQKKLALKSLSGKFYKGPPPSETNSSNAGATQGSSANGSRPLTPSKNVERETTPVIKKQELKPAANDGWGDLSDGGEMFDVKGSNEPASDDWSDITSKNKSNKNEVDDWGVGWDTPIATAKSSPVPNVKKSSGSSLSAKKPAIGRLNLPGSKTTAQSKADKAIDDNIDALFGLSVPTSSASNKPNSLDALMKNNLNLTSSSSSNTGWGFDDPTSSTNANASTNKGWDDDGWGEIGSSVLQPTPVLQPTKISNEKEARRAEMAARNEARRKEQADRKKSAGAMKLASAEKIDDFADW